MIPNLNYNDVRGNFLRPSHGTTPATKHHQQHRAYLNRYDP